jgi:hypothetical protein
VGQRRTLAILLERQFTLLVVVLVLAATPVLASLLNTTVLAFPDLATVLALLLGARAMLMIVIVGGQDDRRASL